MLTRETLRYFKNSFWLTLAGLVVASPIGYLTNGVRGIFETLFIVLVLGILEISLSFDNAVVNAVVLQEMTPKWRHRFLTWGIAVSVFGMRLLFPLLIIAIVAQITPWAALILAAREPKHFEIIMTSSHVSISAYGGTFLLMVGLKYFFDYEKEVHWINRIERPLSYLGRAESVEIALALVILLLFYNALPSEVALSFLRSGIWGVVTYIGVEAIGTFLNRPSPVRSSFDLERASLGLFLYLEVLDASFSFDGVIGAFALTNNLFVMMIGLGIGALFVRNLTIMLVDRQTLGEYRYLEHGAFWAILALAACMYASVIIPIPEYVTGLLGGIFIALSFWSSVRHNRAATHLKSVST